MAIPPGTRIGPYDVLSLIGAGGMGEVYRARDSRLGRDVAIKVLPAAFSADADRLHRFEQEARAAAALNHPNILTVHEIGSHAPASGPAVPYVVSELLEGRTLRDSLAETPKGLSVRKAVDYATQLTHGLAAAHERGIVHRDLKPENIFITRDGRVKILDFGLAKLKEDSALDGAGTSMLATQTGGTGAGVVLGTVGYMSPEQVRAHAVDYRSDIFSFGAVLYEMLSGRRAFKGATAADTITAILTAEPADLSADHASVTPALDRILRHCLEKAPELRFQSARDIAFNLEALTTMSATGTMVAAAPRPQRTALYASLAAIAVAAAAATGLWRFAAAQRGNPVFRQVTFRHGELDNARFTADGRNIIYTASWEGAPPEIFTVPANESGGRPLGILNARLLAVSRTGELALALEPARPTPSSIILVGTLAKGSMSGGAPKAEIESIAEADYAPDGKSLAIIRFVPNPRECLLEYPIGTVLYRSPMLTDLRFSPDGKHLAVIEHASISDDRGKAVILRVNGDKVATGPLRDSQRGLVWNSAGDEIWVTSPLMDARVWGLDLKGGSRELLNLPGRFFIRDAAADSRVLIDEGDVRRGIVVVADNGASQRDVSWLDYSFLRAISKDGRTIIFDEEGVGAQAGGGGGYRTFVRNVDGSPAVQVGTGYAVAISDDKAWTISMRLDPAPELWLQPVGAGQARRLSPAGWVATTLAQFFADGKRVVFTAREPERRPRTYVLALDGGAPRAITEEGMTGALISPDQRFVAVNGPGGPALTPVDGGPLQPIRGVQPGDTPRGWSDDAQIYVANGPPTLLRIDKLNPVTGTRNLWRELRAPAIVGVRPSPPFITPDGRTYAYGYSLGFSDLFVATGVR
jgi:eukaryotic-like serine/threonine-protein kinase